MKLTYPTAGLTVLALALLTWTAPLTAQEAVPATAATPVPAPAAATPADEDRYRVHSSRTVPLPDGRNLIIRRVTPLALPPPPTAP